MLKIKYLIILSTLLSCSTYGPKDSQPFLGERSVATNPADCSSLISAFLSSVKKAEANSFHSKLAKYGYRLAGNNLYKGSTSIAEIEVITPRYLYEWQDKEYHDSWIANGGILKEDMDLILAEPSQSYGKGYYVSLHPTDSNSYGSHLTVFKIDQPLMLLKNVKSQDLLNDINVLNELRKIGLAGRRGTNTWLTMINEDFLSKAVRMNQGIFEYSVKNFNLDAESWLSLINQLSLAGKKVSHKDVTSTLLEIESLDSFTESPNILVEAMRQMTPAEVNKMTSKADSDIFLRIYSNYHSLNGSLTEEDYKGMIKILLNSKNNISNDSITPEFFKELVAHMSRAQFNQIANKAVPTVFVKLYSELILAGKKISDDEYKNIINAFTGPNFDTGVIPTEAGLGLIRKMKEMPSATFNQIASKANTSSILSLYSRHHVQNGSIAEEDYQNLINILLRTKINITNYGTSPAFFKELVAKMSRAQFNQIANKSEATVFVKLYLELILAGKAVSDEEYKNVLDAFVGPYVSSYNISSEVAIKLIRKMDYEQFAKLVAKGQHSYFEDLMSQFSHSKAFFDLFDLFDIATIGKIKTDESLSFQDMLSYAKKYEDATANIDFEQINNPNDFKKLLKNVFEIDYTTRSEDVIMTPYVKNKFTINISQNSYDYVNKNKLLNLSQKKIMRDKSIDLMVSYLELENLEVLRPIFSKSEYQAILKLKDDDKERALKLMIDTFLKKLFDRNFYAQIPKLLYGKENSAHIDLYQIFVSLHPFDDGNGRAARLYLKWLTKSMNAIPQNLLNEADILVPHPLTTPNMPRRYERQKMYYASKIWVLSAESEEEMINRAQILLRNDEYFSEILKDLPYLKRRL